MKINTMYKAALISSQLLNTASKNKFVALYSGPVPTKEQLRSVVGGSGNIDLQALRELSVGRTLLGMIPNFTAAVNAYVSGGQLVIPFSAASLRVTPIVEGTPTWFLYATASSAVTNAETGSAQLYMPIVGTVGDENSSADMIIVGGNLLTGVNYQLMDIKLNL